MHYLPGCVRCPLAGVGTRGAEMSNRLAIDHPSTEVTVEPHRITIRDERTLSAKTTIAEVRWIVNGVDAGGHRVPFTIAAEISKVGASYRANLEVNERGDIPRHRIEIEPFEIVSGNGQVLVSGMDLVRVSRRSSLATRLGRAVVMTKDHLAGIAQDPELVGYRVVDRSLGLGALGIGIYLVRSRLVSLSATNAALIRRRDLGAMLREGRWELAITALTERWLPDLMKRDLFLYHLEDAPLLRDVRAHGLKVGQTLAFRCGPGLGQIGLDGVTEDLPNALDVARAYLELNTLGGMIADAV